MMISYFIVFSCKLLKLVSTTKKKFGKKNKKSGLTVSLNYLNPRVLQEGLHPSDFDPVPCKIKKDQSSSNYKRNLIFD